MAESNQRSSMLPKGIFGIVSAGARDFRTELQQLRAQLSEDEAMASVASADGCCVLGVVSSTMNTYPCALTSSPGTTDSIGVFDGFMYEDSPLESQPHLLAGMSVSEVSSEGNGMFLAASYRNGVLRLLSDPWATSPLYYSATDTRVVFSTSVDLIRGWMDRDADREIDEGGISQLLCFGTIIDGSTVFRGIRKMGRATLCTFSMEGTRCDQTAQVYYDPVVAQDEYRGIDDDIAEIFSQAVACVHAKASGSVISALSGGLDSRAIAAVLHARHPETVYVTHYTHEGHDLAIAREIAKRLSQQHHELPLDDRLSLDAEMPTLVQTTNGMAAFNNMHAPMVYTHYAAAASWMIDGNHTWIEGRWFMRNSAGRIKTKDDFFQIARKIYHGNSVLEFVHEKEQHMTIADEVLWGLLPDLKEYESPGCAADLFTVRHVLPNHGTDLALLQNHYLRYASPYFDRRYVDVVSKVREVQRWKQQPQYDLIRRFAPQMRNMPRCYSDVLTWPTDNPWLQRVPVAFERAYDKTMLRRFPRLHAALSRRQPTVRYALHAQDLPAMLTIDDALFNKQRIREALSKEPKNSITNGALFRLLQYINVYAPMHKRK